MSSMPEVVMVADHGEVIAVVRRHQDITEVFRLMKERLGLSNEFCDSAGGLVAGHTDKILGPSEIKQWGPTTFDLFCEIFGIEFHVHVDLDAVKRMESVWEYRKRPGYPNKKISKKLIERAKPYVIRDFAAHGGRASHALLTSEQSTKKARKAARKSSRTKKLSPERRVEIARRAAAARWPKPEITDLPCALAAEGALTAASWLPPELLSDQSRQLDTIPAPAAVTPARS